jgi:hypothetical protein
MSLVFLLYVLGKWATGRGIIKPGTPPLVVQTVQKLQQANSTAIAGRR